MADKKFDLGDYVEVKDRIRVFYELFGTGRLVTSGYELTREPDDKPKVIVTALAYRTPDDPHPGVGTSWMYLPGRTSYTLGSEIENVETSAWGRAIGSLGILIDKSIASANEIDGKRDEGAVEIPPRATPPAHNPDGSLIGTAEIGSGNSDYEPRPGPKGSVLSFRLRSGRQTFKVVAEGAIADALAAFREDVLGKTVTCWGRISTDSFTNGQGRKIEYQVLALERIATAAFVLPAESLDEIDPEIEAAIDAVPVA